ncbi:hypothetical protein BH11MYX1_BH11MYX1_30440 [soil metagenome]
MQLVIAEKPSVARDLARVLGVRPTGRDAFEGSDHVITWCIGHLVELDEPASYQADWKSWRLDVLPMLPTEFRLRASKHAAGHLKTVRALLRDRRFTSVINACDAGREGELIFRYVYQYAGARLPVRRLWISSLTDEAIRRGLATLRPAAQLDPLADAARSRSEADWLVGMNATRAVTVRNRQAGHTALYSIGRVQTPTLAMIVAREQAIRAFVPRDYWEVRGDFTTSEGRTFGATWRHGDASRLARAELADQIVARDQLVRSPVVESVRGKIVREAAPQLFDLTSLQRTANRRFGFTATRTLELAQALYERHKILTYPRTDSRHLSNDLIGTLPDLFRAMAALSEYEPFATPLLASPPAPTRRVFDDAKVSDHHAIIPTGATVRLAALDRDEHRLFDLVARRFLGVFHPDAEFAITETCIRVGAGDPVKPPLKGQDAREPMVLGVVPPPPDRYHARGRVRLVAGWQAVAGIDETHATDEKGEPVSILPALGEGQLLTGRFVPRAKQTTPPVRHTEATLLGAMEAAGKAIDDETLRAAMKDSGLGTPATRAAIIETLLRRDFISRERQYLVPTETGTGLIEALPVSSLASPALTGNWEARLARIARGEDSRTAFMTDIARYVSEIVDAIRTSTPAPPPANQPAAPAFSRGKHGRVRRRDGNVGKPGSGGRSTWKPGRRGGGEQPRASASPGARSGTAGGSYDRDLDLPDELANTSGCAAPPRATSITLAAQPRRVASAATAPSSSKIELHHDDGIVAALRATARVAGASTATYKAAAPQPPRAVTAHPVEAPRTATQVAPVKPKRTKVSKPEANAHTCPRCRAGTLLTGSRGWGCSRWREGCNFVVWFETAGKKLTPAQLRDLVTRGKTRTAKFVDANGRLVTGHLELDVNGAEAASLETPSR